MSLLETFVIKFATDNEDLKKGAEEAKKTTDDLGTTLKSSNDMSNRLGKGLTGLIRQYGGVITAALSLGSIIKGVNDASNYAASLGRVSQALGISTEALDAWGAAVKRNGGSAEGFLEVSKNLTLELAKFARTGGSTVAPYFQMLNIRMTDAAGNARDLFEILPELADKFKNLSAGQSFEFGKALGLDEATILLLRQGSQEIDQILRKQRELGTVTKEDAAQAIKFNEAWDDTKKAFRGLWTSMGSSLLPAFTKVLNFIQKIVGFLRENKNFMVGVFIALGTAIATFLLPPLTAAAAEALILYAPFLLIGAAVAALSLLFAALYDDIMNFIEGNDSLIGKIIEKWPIVGKIIEGVVQHFKNLWTIAKLIFNFILSSIESMIEGFKKAIDIGGKIADFVKGIFGGKNEIAVKNTKAALDTATGSNIGAISSNAISNSQVSNNRNVSNSVSTGPVTIQTQATDADGIAGGFTKSLEKQLKHTGSSFDDGVLA